MDHIALGDSVVSLEAGRILRLVWMRGTRIEAENARAAMEAINKIANGRKYPLLVDMAATSFLSRRAREVFAQPSAASRVALLGESPVDRMLVDYQLSNHEPPCPTRFFTSKVDAMACSRVPRTRSNGRRPTKLRSCVRSFHATSK